MEWNIVVTICHVCWCKTRWTVISSPLCYVQGGPKNRTLYSCPYLC